MVKNYNLQHYVFCDFAIRFNFRVTRKYLHPTHETILFSSFSRHANCCCFTFTESRLATSCFSRHAKISLRSKASPGIKPTKRGFLHKSHVNYRKMGVCLENSIWVGGFAIRVTRKYHSSWSPTFGVLIQNSRHANFYTGDLGRVGEERRVPDQPVSNIYMNSFFA